MRIAVTGGAGFIGTHLVSALLKCGHDVQVYDNLFTGRAREDLPWLPQVQFVQADIVGSRRLREEMVGFRPDLVYHLAALHYIPYCDQHPAETMRTNVGGTLNVMLAAAWAANVKAVLYASSVAVYPPTDAFHSELDEPGPCDIYGVTKLVGEKLVEQYARQANISHLSLRFANVYGSQETNPHVIPVVLDQLLGGSQVLHVGKTDAYRDFIHQTDLVDALLAAIPVVMREQTHDVLNIGTGQEWSVREAIDILCCLSGRKVGIVCDQGRVRHNDRQHLRTNIAHARKLLAWNPKHDLRSGLELTFDLEVRKRNRRAAAARR